VNRYWPLSSVMLLLAACSAAPTTNENANASQAGIICEKEAPVGSHLARERCTTAADRESLRRQTEAAMAAPRANTPPKQ
jgi:hypothetical protein